MKYYLIVGEASGDLHASRLMASLRQYDPAVDVAGYVEIEARIIDQDYYVGTPRHNVLLTPLAATTLRAAKLSSRATPSPKSPSSPCSQAVESRRSRTTSRP